MFGKTVDRLILVAFLMVCGATAHGQNRITPCSTTTPNNALCTTWGAVTTDVSGNPIAGVTYRVERKLGSAAYATVLASTTSTQYLATNLAVGTHFIRVFANCSACTAESAASNEASGGATAIPVVPNSPVIIIAATIRADGPPIYRIIQSVTLKPNEIAFVAPASMRPLFTN